MSKDVSNKKDKNIEIRDISDFCEKWGSLRKIIDLSSLRQSGCSEDQLTIIENLIELADKTCPIDYHEY